MNSDKTANIVLKILSSYIKGEQINMELTEEQISDLFLIMKAHDLIHIPGLVLKNANTDPKYEVFTRAQYLAALRYERQQYERKRITELFEEHGIKHVHLKGSVIARFYREPWHRTSCDIDILVHDEDLEKAANFLIESFGYTLKTNMTNHDYSLILGDTIHVELHYDLCKSGITLSDAWNTAVPAPNMQYEFVFTPEIIMLYHYAHMANHFKYGGYGLKSMIDLYLLEHNLEYDKDILNTLLIKGGIKKFADTMQSLTDVWFSGAEGDEKSAFLTGFIFDSGAYGSMKHTISMLLHESKGSDEKSSGIKYVLNRVFLPYDNLKYIYPSLQKHKSLIPIYQVRRWASFLSHKRFARVKNEVKTYAKMDKETPQKIADMLSELELL